MACQSAECMDLCVSLGHREFLHSLHVVSARQNALSQDVMSQVDDFQLKKRAFLNTTLRHSRCSSSVHLRIDHAVCEIQLTQGILHEMLKGHGGITQPKRHAGELVEPKVTHCEGCVLL